MNEQRNFFIIFFVIFITLFGYDYFFSTSRVIETDVAQSGQQDLNSTQMETVAEEKVIVIPKDVALREGQRVMIDTPSFSGSIHLKGARFDDIVLKKYKETVDERSPNVDLLNPENTENPFYVDFKWVSVASETQPNITFPSETTEWVADHEVLTPEKSVILRWTSPEGVIFERHISVDHQQMFTVKDVIRNTLSKDIQTFAKGRIVRMGNMTKADSQLVHEGIVGYLGGKLKEMSYEDIETSGTMDIASQGGWVGMTDKYWIAALAVADQTPVTAKIHFHESSRKNYHTEILGSNMTVASGGEVSFTYQLMTGAKIVNLLDQYETEYHIKNFDLAVDFGWFYFITKPMYHVLTFLKNLIGNFALAILALTVLVKLFMFPLARKSSASMLAMKALQPEIERIKKLYEHDTMQRNQAMMELYRQHKINPLGGFLPLFIQMPIFFSLYKVLYIAIEMRHAPFWGWIKDMSVADPTTIFNLFGLIPWDPPSFLMIGLWPMIMGGTIWLQQRLTPQPAADPAMKQMMMFLPIFLVYIMSSFPAGLLIYWSWNNILTILQQMILSRQSESPLK